MFSIKIDNDIVQEIKEVEITNIIPHEKVLIDKKEVLKENLKYKDDQLIISTILICSQSKMIIDGHHRYFTLKKLGFKKIPVTQIDYFSEDIRTGINEENIKHKIIAEALNGNLLEPKSTSHKILSHKSKTWEPIILLSSLSKIEIKNDQESQ